MYGNQPLELKTIRGSKTTPVRDGAIYWHIREDRITADMDKYKVILAFENGFKILEKYFYPIQFKSTGDPKEAEILIGFYNNGDPDLPIKFRSDILAYAYPYMEQSAHRSNLFFNDAYKWAEMAKTGREVNLQKVFCHEALHALGFDHSDFKDDILYWQYQDNDQINFTADTTEAIKKFYAAEMAKIKAIPNNDQDIKSFCKNVIDFKKNAIYIQSPVVNAVLKYFGLEVSKNRLINKSTLIKYLDNA